MLPGLGRLRGIPAHIRSDNGPEFVAKAVQEWIAAVGQEWLAWHDSEKAKRETRFRRRQIFWTAWAALAATAAGVAAAIGWFLTVWRKW